MDIINKIYEWMYVSEERAEIFKSTIKDIIIISLIIVSMYLIIKIGSYIIERTLEKQASLKISLDEMKAKTLAAVFESILKYSVYFFGISAILSRIFGTISITIASIGGVAIGFGAQSFIKDVINGLFILFENQFAVGEFISIDNKQGIVESVEVRLTKLRDQNGDLHIIPNGSITNVTNHSRGNMRIIVEVDIAYEQNTNEAIKVLEKACQDFANINEDITEVPTVVGVTALKDTGATIRIVGKAKPMTQWACENELRKQVKEAIKKAGIELPYPKFKSAN